MKIEFRSNSRVVEKLFSASQTIKREYCRNHLDPWVVAYSGGKDSSLLLQLVVEVINSVPTCKRRRKIYVVGNDTLVESPLVIKHLEKSLELVRSMVIEKDYPIEIYITKPHIDQTFWVNVIGRGYIPPTRNFRWCTDRLKLSPTKGLIENLVRNNKRAVLLVGTRKSESINRGRNMKKFGVTGKNMNPHSTIKGCRMFAPLAEFDDNDVWVTLMQRNPPWGDSHRDLITLYRNAGGGECPLILTKEDAPSCGSTSPRFGCWTCTVVSKDRSLQGLVDSGHEEARNFSLLYEFREWLVNLREESRNRQRIRRDGKVKFRADGTLVLGPFTIQVRKLILEELQMLEKKINQNLISDAEIELIEDIWRRDQIREEYSIFVSDLKC